MFCKTIVQIGQKQLQQQKANGQSHRANTKSEKRVNPFRESPLQLLLLQQQLQRHHTLKQSSDGQPLNASTAAMLLSKVDDRKLSNGQRIKEAERETERWWSNKWQLSSQLDTVNAIKRKSE